jgi:hypothetical protein
MARTGRPSSFNLEIAGEICGRIAAGESLNRICKEDGMPDQVTVYRWIAANEDFRKIYAQAREEQAETLADEITDLADEEPVQVVDDKGTARVDSGWVTWQKNRVDARKWVAAKLKPRKYGDKLDLTSDGKQVGLAININLKDEAA